MKTTPFGLLPLAGLWLGACAQPPTPGPVPSSLIQPTGKLKPVDSKLRVRVGEAAPDFTLPAVSGRRVSLSSYRGRKNVIPSFGVLRSDGTAERALILIDKQGVIRWIDVHDINVRPPIEELATALEKL